MTTRQYADFLEVTLAVAVTLILILSVALFGEVFF